MSRNVLEYDMPFHYYIRHPIKWWRHTKGIVRAVWRRATKGWCYNDVWNFDRWFLDVVPEMLNFLAEHHHICEKGNFHSPEEWSKHLHNIAALLENAREDKAETLNEYTFLFHDAMRKQRAGLCSEETVKTISQKYLAREKQISDQQDEWIVLALEALAKTPLKAIWD